ncbi:MAG: hypothetical protein ACR2NX_06975 [Chthoniobacterales bacterium]
MKKLHQISPRGFLATGFVRMTLSFLLMAGLAGGLWFATLPAAHARTLSPTEMIQEGLPPGKTMRNANKPEFLSAVCAAVKKHRPEASQITRIAVMTHHEYSGDIVATILRCSSSLDCGFVGRVVTAAIQVAPSEVSVIQDAALAIAPDCADAIQAATILDSKDAKDTGEIPAEGPGDLGPISQVPLPGSVGGGGGGINPGEQVFTVCDNGTQRSVRASLLGAFLTSHPGSFVGSCQPTPTTNR